MSRAAVIGESWRVEGFALAGAVVYPAEDEAAVRAAWHSLSSDVQLLIVTAKAAASLAAELTARPGLLPVVMPP
ncbi:MAG: V-type ATP synthase subunit F [Streptosporangiaceae bacterium]